MGYKYFMNNPCGARVGDCAVRAISKALNISWEEAYAKLAINGYRMCDMPSSNTVIASVLRQNGFYRENLPDYGDRPYTVREFAERNPIERTFNMNERTLENFRKLPEEKQEQLIALILRFQSDYQQVFAEMEEDSHIKQPV